MKDISILLLSLATTYLLVMCGIYVWHLSKKLLADEVKGLPYLDELKEYATKVNADEGAEESRVNGYDYDAEFENQQHIQDYNLRIARLKAEIALANASSTEQREYSTADVLHKGVYNVPHEDVDMMINRTIDESEEYSQ